MPRITTRPMFMGLTILVFSFWSLKLQLQTIKTNGLTASSETLLKPPIYICPISFLNFMYQKNTAYFSSDSYSG